MILINRTNKNVTFRIDRDRWRRILGLAWRISWDPEGTCPPDNWSEEEHWDLMNYFINVGQMVSSTDALGLSNALEKLILIIKEMNPKDDEDVYWAKVIWNAERHRKWAYGFSLGLKDEGNFFLFTEWWELKMENLVQFCHHGAFMIC